MPRNAKRQPVQTPAGQAYGVAGEQKAAMNAIPLPANDLGSGAVPPTLTSPAPGPMPPPGAAPTGAPPDMAGQDPLAGILQAASQVQPPTGGLDAATNHPTEPVTAGIPAGPGPGPEALTLNRLQPSNPVADTLNLIAQANGNNPALRQLASRAAARRI